jgi:hypothetical protein
MSEIVASVVGLLVSLPLRASATSTSKGRGCSTDKKTPASLARGGKCDAAANAISRRRLPK